MASRKGSFGTSLTPFGGGDLSQYQIPAVPTTPIPSASPSSYGYAQSAAEQAASYVGSDYGQDFGSDYWNSLLTSDRWRASSALEAQAMADARAAGARVRVPCSL